MSDERNFSGKDDAALAAAIRYVSLEQQRLKKTIDPHVYVDEMVAIALEAQQDAYRLEQEEARRFGQENGLDSLTTDTSGNRSAIWMGITGKAFATGIATSCVAAALVDPTVGMAAAHHNSIDATVIRRNLMDVVFKDRHYDRSQSEVGVAGQMLLPDDIQRVVGETVDDSFAQFDLLRSAGKLGNLTMLMVGMSFATPEIVELAEKTAVAAVTKAGAVRPYLNGVDLDLRMHFGQPGGIIHGGQNHPQFPFPTIYNLS